MGRWTAALRALFNDEQPVFGFLEALSVGPKQSPRFEPVPSAPPARTPGQTRRVLAWMAEAGNGAVGFPDGDVLLGQIVQGLAATDPQGQRRIREELASHLTDPGDPCFAGALRVAGRVPLPEAKPALLRLLTMPPPGAGGPGAETGSVPHYARYATGPGSANGRAGRLDYRAAVLGALGILRDPQLSKVFEAVLAKHADRRSSDPARTDICREAAVALVILDPKVLGRSLPAELSTDPLVLNRLVNRQELEVRCAVSAWLNTLPPPTRSRVADGLAALRAHRTDGGLTGR